MLETRLTSDLLVLVKSEETVKTSEPGNYQYEYYKPLASKDELCLIERWVSSEALAAHGKTDHYRRLQVLKQEYVTDMTLQKYLLTPLS